MCLSSALVLVKEAERGGVPCASRLVFLFFRGLRVRWGTLVRGRFCGEPVNVLVRRMFFVLFLDKHTVLTPKAGR